MPSIVYVDTPPAQEFFPAGTLTPQNTPSYMPVGYAALVDAEKTNSDSFGVSPPYLRRRDGANWTRPFIDMWSGERKPVGLYLAVQNVDKNTAVFTSASCVIWYTMGDAADITADIAAATLGMNATTVDGTIPHRAGWSAMAATAANSTTDIPSSATGVIVVPVSVGSTRIMIGQG